MESLAPILFVAGFAFDSHENLRFIAAWLHCLAGKLAFGFCWLFVSIFGFAMVFFLQPSTSSRTFGPLLHWHGRPNPTTFGE